MNELFAEIDVLLNLEQYQIMIPDTLASYLPYGTLIKFETLVIPISHISELCEAPHSLLKWDSSTLTLDQVSQQVGTYFLRIPLNLFMHDRTLLTTYVLIVFGKDAQ